MFIAVLRSCILFFLILLPAALSAQAPPTASQQASTKGMKLDTGEEIFNASCIGCHGPGGVGQPETILGFEPPPAFPDFTDCLGSAREKKTDWSAIIHEGGPVRAFSDIMPSWKDALTDEQIGKVIDYLRSRCEDPAWPVGELNFPRALFTEKAFPEDEWLFRTSVKTKGSGAVSSRLFYEKRFGARNQVELTLPYSLVERSGTGWEGGIGDIGLAYKRVLATTMKTGSILTVQGEVIVPSGNRSKNFGSGFTTFEPFLMFGQALPRESFLQIQSGVELPTGRKEASNAFFWRAALGKTLAEDRGTGRAWSPMVEFLADREWEDGARTQWDIVPQVQITLNRRQHVRLNIGVRTPLNERPGRATSLAFYLLWDTFDGSWRIGW